jgi:uncharacterized protein YdhG (YjbR/CyaY superfamily)
MTNPAASPVDAYIAEFPAATQKLLQQMRTAIRKAAPRAEEAISYGLATYKLNGNLVHFGGFKGHVSFFPTPSGIEAFKEELTPWKVTKGTIQFPLDAKLPLGLITRITKFRVKETEATKKR